MQSSRTSSWTAESNSLKNESQGSGIVLLGCVGKMFLPQIRNQVPLDRYWRAVYTEPGALNTGHGIMAESVFGFKTPGFQPSLALSQFSNLITAAGRV